MRRWLSRGAAGTVFALAAALAAPAWSQAPRAAGAEVVPGVVEAQLSPDYWIDRLRNADRVILDRDAIAAQNATMQRIDPSMHDIEQLPVTLEAEQVQAWIEKASPPPTRTLYDEAGKEGSQRAIDKLVAALNLKGIPQTQVTRYAMVVRRANLRTFPTHLRVFSTPDDRDIDRFQESALFPGTPVAVVHESRDRRWLFVLSQTYAAWIEAGAVAFGDKDAIFAHARRAPFVVVTGAKVHTVHTPENAAASDVQLDMGVRLPLAQWPADEPLNGQHPGFGHVVDLPARNADGTLAFVPALIPRSADVSPDYLPLTKANLIRQAFKFLGERYGWGHGYNARDCSGFVSEIYRSMGVLLPRNTSDQSRSPALNRIALDEDTGHDERLRLLQRAEVGDLVYIPGHVMMVLGRIDGETYVIHDTSGMSLSDGAGGLRRFHLNGVVVTPLLPMMSNATTATVDRITNIQRIRP
ncbi:NlpC-P60 family protein [Luteimonas marina]|uniref:NlpC-P60 family protein n=1 Tax=Luteimonas marina TaxID=488485 RepID=A0A5C5UBA6_9GAMM|nr:SH3 domain-containing protein [Luteimonas marina]TWT23611.1 NlpC-P60 family protein [Luteimonas marina]